MFLCMVAEREGKIVGSWAAEIVGELKFVTLDAQVTAEAKEFWWEPLCVAAKNRGIRYIQVPVPKNADEHCGRALEEIGMYRSENDFYIGDLR